MLVCFSYRELQETASKWLRWKRVERTSEWERKSYQWQYKIIKEQDTVSAIIQCDKRPTKDTFTMYNLNVNVASSAAGSSGSNLLGVESSCTTPKTPEILNSLIAMTNPFDGYAMRNVPRIASCPPGGSDTSSSSAGSPLGSPSCTSPPSVQHTCSQLIKEGLKLTIQTKRRNTGRHLEDPDAPRGGKMGKRDEVSRLLSFLVKYRVNP